MKARCRSSIRWKAGSTTITDRLSTSGEAFASLLDTRIAKLTDTTDGLTRSLTDLLDDRTTGMVSLLGGAARTLNSEFEASLNGIERTLAERGQALISEFQTRAEALDTGTQKLNAALEARARQINETLVERAREIAHTFAESKDTLSAMIDQGKTQIGADMADIVTSTSTMLEARASDFAGRMEAARHVVSRSFDADIQRLADARVGIEEAVENHSRKLSESRDRMAARHAGRPGEVRRRPRRHRRGRHQPGAEAGRRPDLISRALEEDLRKVNESRAAIDASLGGHLERLEEGRNRPRSGSERRLRTTCSSPYDHR